MEAKRVLMVCYYFPPLPSVGSVRVGALARELPRFGWDVGVVTPRRPGRGAEEFPLFETGDRDLASSFKRRLGISPDRALKDQVGAQAGSASPFSRLKARAIDHAKALVAYPDPHRGWVRLAVDAALRAQEAGRFDAVLTSSPPIAAHVAGRWIKASRRTPWVADLRDLWSDDHNSTAPQWRRALDRRLERRTFRGADALVTVSEPLARRLRELHPRVPAHTILNGFDAGHAGPAEHLTDTFSITHTGTFYQGRRDPTPFLETLAALLDSGRIDRARVRVRLFSRGEPWLADAVLRFGLADVVQVHSWVGWEQALLAQQESQVLLLLHRDGPEEVGVYTGKIFEYLGARRPILIFGGGPGVLSDLMSDTGAGVHVRDRSALERQLLEWWNEFETHGAVCYRGDEGKLERYTHERMAREFAGVLDAVQGG